MPLVLQQDDGHVRRLTFNRPEQLNAFNEAMYTEAAAAVRDATADGGVRAIVLTGAGKAFSAGQDLSEMQAVDGDLPTEPGFVRFVNALTDCDKPILSAVNGVGVGIGLTMLLHTDLNYFAEGARLKGPFVTLGVVPEAGASLLLPVAMGYSRAADFLFTARWLSAEEAVAAGIGIAVVPRESLLDVVSERAREVAACPPEAVQMTKKLMTHALRDAVLAARDRENDAFRTLLGSPENLAAIQEFFSRGRK